MISLSLFSVHQSSKFHHSYRQETTAAYQVIERSSKSYINSKSYISILTFFIRKLIYKSKSISQGFIFETLIYHVKKRIRGIYPWGINLFYQPELLIETSYLLRCKRDKETIIRFYTIITLRTLSSQIHVSRLMESVFSWSRCK